MSNTNYWEERLKQDEINQKFIEENTTSTMKQIVKNLAGTRDNLIKKILALMEKIQSGKVTSVSDYYTYQEYYKLLLEIEKKCSKWGIDTEQELTKRFGNFYLKSFDLAGDFLKRIGAEQATPYLYKTTGEFYRPAPDWETAMQVVNQVWVSDGKRWSERIWGEETRLATKLQQVLTDGVVGGATLSEMKERLVKEFSVTYNSADRLVRTEYSHLLNTATMQRYQSIGIEKFIWITARNEKVCPNCKNKDGEIFLVSDPLNFPPVASHPNCCCSTIPILPGEDEKVIQERFKAKKMRKTNNMEDK